jgi:hypothetical protein
MSSKNLAFLLETMLIYAKIYNISFLRKAPIFSLRKLTKIAENCDHNIGPRIGFLHALKMGQCVRLGSVL